MWCVGLPSVCPDLSLAYCSEARSGADPARTARIEHMAHPWGNDLFQRLFVGRNVDQRPVGPRTSRLIGLSPRVGPTCGSSRTHAQYKLSRKINDL